MTAELKQNYEQKSHLSQLWRLKSYFWKT